ncbi:lipopolysaccharide biosynthesis protein [Actinophytocola sediminis]
MAERIRLTALLVTIGVAGNQAASYLLNVAGARLLVPADFGELGSLLAVLVVGAVPAMGLQTAAALRIARAGRDGASQLCSLGLTTSAVVTAVTAGSAPLLMALLHLDSIWPALCVAASLASITMTCLWYGMLQGTRRFGALAALLGCEGLVRIGGTAVGLAIFRDATGALACTAIGALVVAMIGWVVVGRPRPARHHRGHIREVLHAVQAMLALVLLVNLDLVLARHHLPADEAGEYAVGAIVTKIAYWLPQAVAILVLPRLADAAGRRRFVPVALLVCAALDSVVVLGTATMGPTVVAIIGGADYAGSDLPLWAFAIVGSLLSLVQILLYSRIASADRRSTLLIWAAVVVEAALVTLWLHHSLAEVVTAAVVATGLLVGAGALVELRARRVEPVDAHGHGGGRGQQ